MLVANSGFEDVVYQSNVCSSGSLNGVFSGSLYTKAWHIHNVMSEALKRLLLQRFIGEVSYMRFVSTLHCLIIGGRQFVFSKIFHLQQHFCIKSFKIMGKMEKNLPILFYLGPDPPF